jgi:hypothetical protein
MYLRIFIEKSASSPYVQSSSSFLFY